MSKITNSKSRSKVKSFETENLTGIQNLLEEGSVTNVTILMNRILISIHINLIHHQAKITKLVLDGIQDYLSKYYEKDLALEEINIFKQPEENVLELTYMTVVVPDKNWTIIMRSVARAKVHGLDLVKHEDLPLPHLGRPSLSVLEAVIRKHGLSQTVVENIYYFDEERKVIVVTHTPIL